MPSQNKPILYANDTCPYVFRARIALQYSDIEVEHREVAFNNKPPSMLQASAKGTVPTLVLTDGSVIDESWQVIKWAVQQNDPDNWLGDNNQALVLAERLVEKNDDQFTHHYYYYKYSSNYPERNFLEDRTACEPFAQELENMLEQQNFLNGDAVSIADIPIYPAMNGYSSIEPEWFSGRFPNLTRWLGRMKDLPAIKNLEFDHTPWEF